MKSIICSLIRDDIHHTKLMQRLEIAGFDTLKHTLYLSDSIFNLLELDNSPRIDEVTHGYFDLVKKYNASEGTNLEEFSILIYTYLEGFRSRTRL